MTSSSNAHEVEQERIPFFVRTKVARAIADPGSFVGDRLQSDDGALETLSSWQARAAIKAIEGSRLEPTSALRARIEKARDGYKSQMKFCDIEAMGYFREFVRRIDAVLDAAS